MRCSKILLWVIVMQCCPANARNESEEPNIIIIPDHDESSCTLTGKLKKASNSTNGYKFSTPGESLGNSSMVADKESMEDSLILEVVSSPVLKLGIQLKIDHNGLYRSLRSQQDGVTYIGSQDSEGDTVLNDFVISHHSVSNVHCSVYYNSDSRQFILKDHSDSSGTFMKIMKPIRLASQQIISFVSYHLAVNCINEESQ